jgi:nucleotide-binding universal stress UspA family protein
MKVLIPTDFSKLSKVAVLYGAKMASKLGAKVILLNVVHMSSSPNAMAAMKLTAIEDTMIQDAIDDLSALVKEIKSKVKGKLDVQTAVIKGYPVEDAVVNYAMQSKVDLIIMGTKGATGVAKKLIGSNAAAVINRSKIPVITVPESARFSPLKRIVYSTDLDNLAKEIKLIKPFAKAFNATIHLLHVQSTSSPKAIDGKAILRKLKSTYPKLTFHVTLDDKTVAGIDEYIADKKADLLVMFTHDLTFFESLFGKSVTRKMAFHSQVPLLTLKK